MIILNCGQQCYVSVPKFMLHVVLCCGGRGVCGYMSEPTMDLPTFFHCVNLFYLLLHFMLKDLRICQLPSSLAFRIPQRLRSYDSRPCASIAAL
jgi:hypothetical protein